MKNPFIEEQDIFNGQFKLVTEDNEFRMSHWVKGFGIKLSTTGNWLMQLESSFNLDKYEILDTKLKVNFTVYADRSAQFEVEINPFKQTFKFGDKTFDLINLNKAFIAKQN